MASSIPSGSGGHAVRLQRIDGARQNQQGRSKGTSNAYAGQVETNHTQQAAYLQGYYSDRQAAGVAAQETLSPSHSSNSSPRKLLQSRRQNMMQRRIEMRLRSEERQRQQQQVQHSYGILPSRNNQNPLTCYETHPTQYHAHCQSQSQPQHQVGQQARHMLHSQSGTNQLNMYSKVRGKIAQRNDSSMHHQENVSCHRQNYPQTYPISSQKQQRPPSYSNPPTNLQYPHQNSHPGTQHQRRNIPYADERQQQSPIVTSPPELDRRQNTPLTTRNVGEYPSANLFDGYKNDYTGHYQSDDEHGEGIEIEAQQFLHLVSTQGNASRLPSSRESPSDECLVEEGYYEDRYPQSRNHTVGSHEQQELNKGTTHVSNLPHRQTKQQFTYQQKQFGPIDESKEKKQNQLHPDWHQLNRNRLYQKKFAARYHNAASNSSPKSQAQSLLQTRPPKKTSIANFSPIESLSTRTDQIQRKHRQPLHGESGEPMENIDPLHNGQDQRRELPDESEESVASVLDRARSFEASIAGKNQVKVGGSRSRSVPRERTSHWSFIKFHQANDESRVNVKDPGFGGDRGRSRATLPSQESLTQYIDDDTVTESVASRKKEWEGKLQSSQQRKARSTHESEAFSVWAERADRLAQQRKSEQRSEQRRSIDEKWRRSAVKSLPPERRNHERGSGVYGYDGRYSQEERYRGEEYQFVTQKHLGQDQHSIEQDASLMSIEDRRRMLWDGKERLRAVLPKHLVLKVLTGCRKTILLARWVPREALFSNPSSSTQLPLQRNKKQTL
ncbi:hypothetical protein HJC23_012134 [Cyclotella cryptica]|uniref:Uncharacterized protein n=1 Tax=Cyclotella cryptica TaxID=29204 RepID=A0ABD3PI44_9STRA